jgi:hypothetical protein
MVNPPGFARFGSMERNPCNNNLWETNVKRIIQVYLM